jgi:glycosyltransferase involved in cell wall biosynthesis
LKNVLIITYYFPPVKGAAPWRPYAWCRYFGQHKLQTTVLTRHWNGNEDNWSQMTLPNKKPIQINIENDIKCIKLPTKQWWFYKLYQKYFCKIPGAGMLFYFLATLLGRFGLEVDAYSTFAAFLKSHLKNTDYDAVIITYPPSNLLKLLPIIKINSSAKIIVDFRDWLNNEMLQLDYKPTLKQKIQNKCMQFYAQKHLKFVDAVTVVTPAFLPLVKALYAGPVYINYNGFEHEIFEKLTKQKQHKFTIAYIGNMYANMDMNLMLNGLKAFIENKSDIMVQFIGVASQPEMLYKVQQIIPQPYLTTTAMLDKQHALQYTINADVLLQFGWVNYKGIVGTKTFDYMASGNPVLLAPKDEVMQQLFNETNSGIAVNDVQAFVNVLEDWYKQWRNTGNIKWQTKTDTVQKFSRQNQSKLFAEIIFKTTEKQ